jgi:hypothetical protein
LLYALSTGYRRKTTRSRAAITRARPGTTCGAWRNLSSLDSGAPTRRTAATDAGLPARRRERGLYAVIADMHGRAGGIDAHGARKGRDRRRRDDPRQRCLSRNGLPVSSSTTGAPGRSAEDASPKSIAPVPGRTRPARDELAMALATWSEVLDGVLAGGVGHRVSMKTIYIPAIGWRSRPNSAGSSPEDARRDGLRNLQQTRLLPSGDPLLTAEEAAADEYLKWRARCSSRSDSVAVGPHPAAADANAPFRRSATVPPASCGSARNHLRGGLSPRTSPRCARRNPIR